MDIIKKIKKYVTKIVRRDKDWTKGKIGIRNNNDIKKFFREKILGIIALPALLLFLTVIFLVIDVLLGELYIFSLSYLSYLSYFVTCLIILLMSGVFGLCGIKRKDSFLMLLPAYVVVKYLVVQLQMWLPADLAKYVVELLPTIINVNSVIFTGALVQWLILLLPRLVTAFVFFVFFVGLLVLEGVLSPELNKDYVGICNRTNPVQSAIMKQVTGAIEKEKEAPISLSQIRASIERRLTSCERVSSDRLSAITKLDLFNHNINELTVMDFNDLSGLKELDLSNRSIMEPESGGVGGLTNLKKLKESKNKFADQSEKIYKALDRLEQELQLANLSIDKLEKKEFNALVNQQNKQNELSQYRNIKLEGQAKSIFNALEELNNLLYSNTFSSLPAGIFNDLGSLTHLTLNLSSTEVGKLHEDIFNKLGSLTHLTLNLSSTNAVNLPAGIFNDLGSLTHLTLNLSSTNAVNLPAGIFNDLVGSLTHLTLNLSSTEVGKLHEDIFNKLVKLTHLTLNLSSTEVGKLPAGIFNKLVKLTHLTLNLSSMEVGKLPAGIFNKLVKLTHLTLNLSSTEVGKLPAGIFNKLVKLTHLTLNLSSTEVGKLPAGIFNKLVKLTHLTLNLSSTEVGKLHEDIFNKLGSLTHLDLSQNGLKNLPRKVFDQLTELTHLDLSQNGLENLPPNVFDQLTELTHLDLSQNGLESLTQRTSLTQGVERSGNHREVRIVSRVSTNLPEGIFNKLANLQDLDLSQNGLTSLEQGVFDQLTGLKYLDLSQNGLENLKKGVFAKLEELRYLKLRISQGRNNLRITNVFNSSLRTLSSLGALSQLELDISGEALESLPEGVFDELKNLRVLRLSSNGLKSLPSEPVFKELDKLEYLYITIEDWKYLPQGVFGALKNLEVLRLPGVELGEYSGLEALKDDVFSTLKKLKYLDLSHNDLSWLPREIFKQLAMLKTLNLSNNRLGSDQMKTNNIFQGLSVELKLNIEDNKDSLTTLWKDYKETGGDIVQPVDKTADNYGTSDNQEDINIDDKLRAKNIEPSEPDKTKWLFAIGAGVYWYASPVAGSNQSAKKFVEVARKRFGILEANVELLLENATGDHIEDQLNLMLKKVQGGDTIYFYYSGHSIRIPAETGKDTPYLLALDHYPAEIENHDFYNFKKISQKLRNSKASKVVAIVDSCFSGLDQEGKHLLGGIASTTTTTTSTITTTSSSQPPPLYTNGEMVVLTAGTHTQFSNQLKLEDQWKNHRLFSYYLIQALLEKDISIGTLYNYVAENVGQKSEEMGTAHRQTPQLCRVTEDSNFQCWPEKK